MSLELEPILALGLIDIRSGVTSSRPNRRGPPRSYGNQILT